MKKIKKNKGQGYRINPRNPYVKISHLLDLLVDNDANSMLGYVVHTSRFAMITLVRHSFLDCTCTLINDMQEYNSRFLSQEQMWKVGLQNPQY